VTDLLLRRASTSRPSGEWNENDFDVLADGAVVGSIFKADAAPVGRPWMWTLAFGHHEGRAPTHGYAESCEAAMAAFAKSWRREDQLQETHAEHVRVTEPSDLPHEGRLSDTDFSALRADLVKLITQQGTIFTNWVKFAITIQAGLAAGLGAVFLSALGKYRLLGLIIAFFGVAAAALFATILVRHTQWTTWYVTRGRELADKPQIFPQPGDIPEVKLNELILEWNQLKEKGLGPVIRAIRIFLLAVAIAWGVLFVWLLLPENDAIRPNKNFKTWNDCPSNYTVQGGMCKPYRGP
jgi:hypothetical protein